MKELISVQSTILLVDDEEDILEFTKDEISSYFDKVLLARDGQEACVILKTEKVDLIVTDYVMPNMNGLQLIDFIKSNYPLIPVIMLTSNVGKPEVLEAIKNGAFDVLDKPFRAPVLINRIQNGLLMPELLKTVWAYISHDLSVPQLEEFMRKPLKEQYRIMFAYSSMGKMRAVARSEGFSGPRGKIRFKPEKNEVSFISFEKTNFKNEIAALVLNESAEGAGLIVNSKLLPPNLTIVVGTTLLLKIGNLDPIESTVRWVKTIDSDLVKIGISHPL